MAETVIAIDTRLDAISARINQLTEQYAELTKKRALLNKIEQLDYDDVVAFRYGRGENRKIVTGRVVHVYGEDMDLPRKFQVLTSDNGPAKLVDVSAKNIIDVASAREVTE